MWCCINCAYYALLVKGEQVTHILDVILCMPDTAASKAFNSTAKPKFPAVWSWLGINPLVMPRTCYQASLNCWMSSYRTL